MQAILNIIVINFVDFVLLIFQIFFLIGKIFLDYFYKFEFCKYFFSKISDRPGLKGTTEINRLRHAVARALRFEMDRHHILPLKGDVTVYDHIMAKIPALRWVKNLMVFWIKKIFFWESKFFDFKNYFFQTSYMKFVFLRSYIYLSFL